MLRWFARSMARVYYPRFEVTGGDQIPTSGPVLLCANHANSMLDPVVLGSAAVRRVKFFAKAPLFETPLLGPLMTALGMIPAYRGMDDPKQVRKNLESLDRGIDELLAGNAVGIFPEGKSHDKLQVEKVRSGAARIAIQAVERGAKQLVVVPVGLNYECKDRFRSSVWVQVGEPIHMCEWIAQQAEVQNERQLTRRFTGELQTRLEAVTIHLDEEQWQPWVDDLDLLAPHAANDGHDRVPELRRRKRIADAINHFLQCDRDGALAIAKQIEQFREAVCAAGLRPRAAVLQYPFGAALLRLLWQACWLLVLLLPALAGTVFHLIPFFCVRAIARLLTPPGRTAVSFYRLLVGFPFYLGWYLLATVAIYWQTLSWNYAALVTVMPLLGLLALHYWRAARRIGGDVWCELLALARPVGTKAILQQRGQLVVQISELADEYVRRRDAATR